MTSTLSRLQFRRRQFGSVFIRLAGPLLPSKSAKSREIPRKFELAVQDHPPPGGQNCYNGRSYDVMYSVFTL